MLWTAQPCGCVHESVMGSRRPRKCECGNLFERPGKGLSPVSPNREKQVRKQGGTLKRSQPKRDWTDARAKVELEGCCRVCHREGRIEAAHIIGRRHDRPAFDGSKTLYVDPLSIVPLCPDDHAAFDAHSLDLLPYLAPEEQARAVLDAGGIEAARKRLAPSAYREFEVAA